MNIDEVIKQLESIKDNSASFVTIDSEPIWEQDVEALNKAIIILKKRKKGKNEVKRGLQQTNKRGR